MSGSNDPLSIRLIYHHRLKLKVTVCQIGRCG